MNATPQRRPAGNSGADCTAQFSAAIVAAGLEPPEFITADGALHRFASNGKRGDVAGWYVMHADGIAAGAFGDHRSGVNETWCADVGRKLTAAEQQEQRARIVAMRKVREADEAKRHADAASEAGATWSSATPAPADHPYLARKAIKPHGLRVEGTHLVVPVRANGELVSIQRIAPDGEKRFLSGGRVAGGYFSIGTMEGANALCIVEGVATGATVHEATGLPVAVAFNAGNLLAVSRSMRERFPDLTLIICADDDHATEGNPGMTKATEAARSVGGPLAVPNFGSDRPNKATDFNDMAQHCGLADVAAIIAPLAVTGKTDVTDVTDVQANNGAGSAVTPGETQDVTGVTPPVPPLEERPAFVVFDDWYEAEGVKYRPGVWHFGAKPGTDKAPATTTQQWVCSPLHIEAVTFDGGDNNYGRLLRFRNTTGRWREWSMPMDLLRGAGDDLRGELLAMGVQIDPVAHRLLGQYLQWREPKRRMHCATQVGWCGGSFVLPDAVIGPKSSGVIFQGGERGTDEYTTAGTLAGWQAGIAAHAVGNPLFMLALSAAIAGPLLARCNAESGGLHYVADSSTGKTTLIEAGCSIWGGCNYKRSWRTTSNGLEGAAALFNDGMLALDEISECDPRDVGAIVYALGNGRGKQRASRTGAARNVTRWRCVVLSSGERTIATAMAEGGFRAKAGQSVRLLDIPAARKFGAWDDLHGMPSGSAFSDAIKTAAATHYGHAGRAFLQKLTRDSGDFCAALEVIKARPEFSASDGEGQDKRAAARFALFALAGEVATDYGITGWPQGDAIAAAAEGFRLWQSMRGRGNGERRDILERVAAFIERNGDARFSNAHCTDDVPVRDRAGWWRDEGGSRLYLFNAEGMREALRGFDFRRALDALREAGALPAPDGSGERAKPLRIGGRLVRLYVIHADKLEADHGN